ncbi:uncharacterized protein LOC130728298 [Lotus japonicus]|uniref:uncharacterized protein LOC130728298 n=1 Tax=Lotus japonicus TaxID=34305 RepID=UPI00258AD566|nr:uncharacterized protein LOC130728298 [Lotus japonicus]
MSSSSTGGFTASIPILNGKNWNNWSVKMKAVMGFQDVLEIVEQGLPELAEGATEAARTQHKESKKKDFKALCLLHQGVDEPHFEMISNVKSSKEAWQILEKCNEGHEQLKKVKLQTLRRQYELMQMEPTEKVTQYFNRIIRHKNDMKVCGKTISNKSLVEKILRTLTPRFDHIVVAMEESRNLETLKVEELQGSLEAHEQRLLERSTEKSADQALQAQTSKKNSYKGKSSYKGKGKSKDFSKGNGSRSNQNNTDGDKNEQDQNDNGARRGGSNNWRGGRKKVDRKKVKCYNCNRMGHFSFECKAPPHQRD